jgi:hypothetical protein
MALYAVRGNKHLKITEAERAAHLALGYDIAVWNGKSLKIVETSPAKTVPYAKYKALLDENVALKGELARLKGDKEKDKEGGK